MGHHKSNWSVKNYNYRSYGGLLIKMDILPIKKDQLINLNSLKNHVFKIMIISPFDPFDFFIGKNFWLKSFVVCY
jgi:hypothetical protein